MVLVFVVIVGFILVNFLNTVRTVPVASAAHGVDWVTIIPLVCLRLMLGGTSDQFV